MEFNVTTSYSNTPGGRMAACRVLLVATATGLLIAQHVAMATNVDGGSVPASTRPQQVSVDEENGLYRVSARFVVNEPVAVALAVLTDYEQIPRFMPQVKTSVVRERSEGRTVVEQEALARMMMFSRRIHLVLEVRENADGLSFRDGCRKSFHLYEGAWRVTELDHGTAVVYELSARPSFAVPEFLLKRLLARDAKQMLEHLHDEIRARGATAAR